MSITADDVRKAVGSLKKRLDGVELFDGYHYDENGVVVLTRGDSVTGFCHPEHFKKFAEPYSGDAGDETDAT